MYFLGFLLCAAAIFFFGRKLSYYGDLLAERTGMGKAWTGLILMSAVSSLPELMVGISSVRVVGSADLALGDILGSCAFNLGLLSVMDLFMPEKKALLGQVSRHHILACSFGILLMALVGMGIFLEQDLLIVPSFGLTPLLFALLYFSAIRSLYAFQQSEPAAEHASETTVQLSLRQIVLRYSLFALLIIAAALALPPMVEQIAADMGLGHSFAGTLFLAASTSLPEIAVSLAAVRAGSADMAVGNLTGSNLFNVLILAIDDLFYTRGQLLKDASEQHLISVFFVMAMSAVAIAGFTFHKPTKKWLLSLDTLLIFLLYLLNMVFLYVHST